MEAYTERYKGIIKSEVFQATSNSTPRPQLNEHLSFASGPMDQVLPPSNHPYTRQVPGDTFALSTAKPTMKTINIEEGSLSRDDLDEKGGQSFQTSDSLSQSILVQADHLRSLIKMAGAQRVTDDDSQRLVRSISHFKKVFLWVGNFHSLSSASNQANLISQLERNVLYFGARKITVLNIFHRCSL